MYQLFKMEEHHNITAERQEHFPIYKSINILVLYKVVCSYEVFPYTKVIGWLLVYVDVKHIIIKDSTSEVVASFHPSTLHKCYKFPIPKINLTYEWVDTLEIDCMEFLKHAWGQSKNFCASEDVLYQTQWLRQTYRIIASLLCCLYGD